MVFDVADRTLPMTHPPGDFMSAPPKKAPMAFSSFGSSHGLQTLYGDLLAIRQEVDVVGDD